MTFSDLLALESRQKRALGGQTVASVHCILYIETFSQLEGAHRAGVIAKSGDHVTRVADPTLMYTQKVMEDSEFRAAFCSALSHRMANKPLDCGTLRAVLRQVSLATGPFTTVQLQASLMLFLCYFSNR